MSYKKVLIQNSNPIQFLDPTKFRTLTVSGVSFVSSNGVITANGTASAVIYFAVQAIKIDVFAGHKMLLAGCPSGGSAQKYELYDSGDNAHSIDVGGGAIYPVTVGRSTYIYIYIAKGYVATNLQFKPQFYDLTATFGAGNEPTTLAAFRSKFSNEVYPYNPSYCTSYKKALIANTKNLFNPATANIIDHTTYFTPTGSSTTHFYKMGVEAGATYTVTFDLYTVGGGADGLALGIQTGDHYGDGTRLAVNLRGEESAVEFYPHTVKFTAPANITEVTFSGLQGNQYRNFQIEKGNTATSYVPYGYLNETKSALITPTINLFDESKIINKIQHDGYWTSSSDISGTSGHFYKMTVEPNTTYTVLCGGYVPNTGSDALFYSVQVGNSFYDYTKRLTVLGIGNSNKGWLWRRGAFIVPDGVTEVTFSCFPWAQFRDFMVVKGSVPVTTTYVPYNYI